jgi:hypothetical protein
MLTRRAGPGDAERARALAAEALEAAVELGRPPVADRARPIAIS